MPDNKKCVACGLVWPESCPVNYPRGCALKSEQNKREKLRSEQLASNLLFWVSFIDKGFSFDEVAKLQLRNDLLASADLAIDVAAREALDELASLNKDRLDKRAQEAAQEQARDVTRNYNKGDGLTPSRNFRKLTDAEMEQRQRHRADVELLRRANERVDEHPVNRAADHISAPTFVSGECQQGASGERVFVSDRPDGGPPAQQQNERGR